MFSQWRQAVEGLAQNPPKSSQDLQTDGESQPRSSMDMALRASLSSTQLAESALTSLKRSLVSQRSGSPVPARSPSDTTKPLTHRTTLEDRLRAKFATGDASGSSIPSGSAGVTPTPNAVAEHPLSPASTPLPASPIPRIDNVKDASDIHSPQPIMARSAQTEPSQDYDPLRSASPEQFTSSTRSLQQPFSPSSTPLPDSPVLSLAPEPLAHATSSTSYASHEGDMEPLIGNHRSEQAEQSFRITSEELVESHSMPGVASISLNGLQSASDNTVSEVPLSVLEDAGNGSGDSGHFSPTTIENVVHSDDAVVHTDPPPPDPSSSSEASLSNGDIPGVDTSSSDVGTPTTLPREAPGQPSDTTATTVIRDTGSVDTASDGVVSSPKGVELDIESLQARLKLVEKRFTDVSLSFKRLQAEKLAVDKILQEYTPVESLQDVEALQDYFQNVNLKAEMAQDEIKRLTGKLTRQDERIEELRDIHRLESKSQSDQIEKLKGQVDEAEALLRASQSSTAQLEGDLTKRKAEMERFQALVDRANGVAKEEEEKRVKAIALLKTVRQKLVKAERERDDASKELMATKEREKEEREKASAERQELRNEVERVKAEKDTSVSSLKSHFDREMATMRDRHEKELTALRGQFELEAVATKSSYTRELESKSSMISELQSLVRTLEGEKDEFFDQLQLRQAEVESSRSRLESLESQTTELQYQLREADDRIALLTEELADAKRAHETRASAGGPSAEEVTRLLSAAEAKYESRIGELRRRLNAVERERDEGEAEWSRKLSEKVRELESLKGLLSSSARSREEESENLDILRQEIQALKAEIQVHQGRISELHAQAEKTSELENAAKEETAMLDRRIVALQQLVDESKTREAQFRAHNKTLREELRKVQSSAALLERQRNPGVGYWASRQESTPDFRSPRSSVSDLTRDPPSRPDSPTPGKSDEEINVEYLRNVILQFLEHKEMRPHLVRILSTILRFTPQETRRLVSKV